jgi:poly-gamma-glutamate synthesis protein (capsule biosynthesis protein)
VAITANNHSLDSGASGLVTTIDILEEYGIKSVGTYKDGIDYVNRNPLILNSKGVKIALLSYTYGTNGIPIPEGVGVNLIDTVQMKRDIAHSLVMGADCVISYLHWGAEYSHRPNREQRQIAKCLHRAGCQVVVGSHPHVVQGAEISKQEVTIYSLGNFISNQRMRYSDGGIMAKVRVEKCTNGCQFWLDIEPVWVRASDYTVIPYSVANQIGLSRSDRAVCDLFFDDTHKIFR